MLGNAGRAHAGISPRAAMITPPADEPCHFDCVECGRHIVVIAGPHPSETFNLCAACMMIPGWFEIPGMRERLGLI